MSTLHRLDELPKSLPWVLLSLMIAGCDGNANASATFDYRPIKEGDLQAVRTAWAGRDLRAHAVEIVHEEVKEGYKLLLVRHEVSSRTHYGAIFVPGVDVLTNTPVVVLPDHLDQSYPAIDIETAIAKYQSFAPLTGFIKVIPAFRGRSMNYQGTSRVAEGDFCDAYDGAADDSISMLNVAQSLFPKANFEKVLVWGLSRGGNTALLMAIRDPRVNTVIAAAAPVDFYREDLRVKYGEQYECQFFTGKYAQESRERMLASSPFYFEPHENLESVFLHHAALDDMVPAWNTKEIASHLEASSVNVTTFIYAVEGHGGFLMDESYPKNMIAGIDQFLDNANE